MREIKFRAMTDYSKFSVKLESEMVYGTGIFTDGVNTWLASHDGIRCLADNIAFKIVSKESIGQYTGLKDKNGKEIYEGDILDSPSVVEPEREICEVYWTHYSPGWYARSRESEDELSAFTDDCEVIGNIYENPELVGGKK